MATALGAIDAIKTYSGDNDIYYAEFSVLLKVTGTPDLEAKVVYDEDFDDYSLELGSIDD